MRSAIGAVTALLTMLAPAAPAGVSPPPVTHTAGFLLHIEVQGPEVRLVAASAVERFVPVRHLLPAADDWRVELRDAANGTLWETRLANPRHFSPWPLAGQAIPFSARIPVVPGVVAAVFCDHLGRELLRVPLDESFVAGARRSRQRLLAFKAENEHAVAQWKAVSASAMDTKRDDGPAAVLPEGLVGQVASRLVEDTDVLERYGPEVAGIRDLAVEAPEEMARRAFTQKPMAGGSLRSPAPRLLSGAFKLSGHVRDAENGSPIPGAVIFFYQVDVNGAYVAPLGSRTTDDSGTYSLQVDLGSVYCSFPPMWDARYVTHRQTVKIAGDTTADFTLRPGVLLSGSVRDPGGTLLDNTPVIVQGEGFLEYATWSASTYRVVVPRDRPLALLLDPSPPYARTIPEEGLVFAVDTVRDLIVERGWLVSGDVRGVVGNPIQGVSVVARHVNRTTSSTRDWGAFLTTAADGSYSFVVPKWLQPGTFVLSVHKAPLLRRLAAISVTGDLVQDFSLVPGIPVSGTVRDSAGASVCYARVRAYRDQALVASFWTGRDGCKGTYQLGLEAGTYTFKATADSMYWGKPLTSLAPVEATGVVVSAPLVQDFTLTPATGRLTLRLYLQGKADYLPFGTPRVELRSGAVTVGAGYMSAVRLAYDEAQERYYLASDDLHVKEGTYDLRISAIGLAPFTIPDVAVTGATAADADLPAPLMWSGTVRSADSMPIPHAPIATFDDTTVGSSWWSSDAGGRFAMPITPGGFVKVHAPESGRTILYTERFPDPVESREADCVLDLLPGPSTPGGTVTQIIGIPDRAHRWNIVFIGDGYTAMPETFTDTNGNSQWDGVLFYDYDQNGVLDGDEPWAAYGTASSPTVGTDPTVLNEPFTDANGDGFPNDDQAIFDRNTLGVTRSLLGQDVWRDHRDAFNVFRVRIASNQAGNDVRRDSTTLVSRDTAFGASVNIGGRGLLTADYMLIGQLVYEYVPEADTIIALVNQPIGMGRANSFILLNGGPLRPTANEYTVAHEMGHNLGNLGDEYIEFPDSYLGDETRYPNLTTFTARDQVPWGALIAADKELPSVPLSAGVGLFEGANYHPAGVFRPTATCMMVGGNRFCPVCTREIELRLASLAGGPQGTATPLSPQGATSRRPGFAWSPAPGAAHHVLELRRANDTLVALVDVYGTAWTPSYELPCTTTYRWRVKGVVEDRTGPWSEWMSFSTPASTTRGDANGDCTVDVADVFDLVNALFAGGPTSLGPADANSDGQIDVADVFFLIAFLFAGGPPPVA